MNSRTNYHFAVTLQGTVNGDLGTVTADGPYVAEAGMTRAQAYTEIVQHVVQHHRLDQVSVLFFSLEPNELATPDPNGAKP